MATTLAPEKWGLKESADWWRWASGAATNLWRCD